MRVFILSPIADDSSVLIRTETGKARVFWRGPTRPGIGETNVELDLRGQVRWGTEVAPASLGERMGIHEDGSVVGAVDGLDADGVVKLRLADGLAMIDPASKQPPTNVGDLIRITGVEIDIYPRGPLSTPMATRHGLSRLICEGS